MIESDSAPEPDDSRAADTEDSASDAQNRRDEGRHHPALIATAIALPIALLAGIVVAAVIINRTPVLGPLAVGPVPAPNAESDACTDLAAALPEKLGDYTRAELVEPVPAGTAAWQIADAEPVVLRCGLDRPNEFDAATALQIVDGVQWFEVSGEAEGIAASTWFAVDRPVYVALTVPNGSGPTPLQEVSATLNATLPQQPIDPAPVGGN
ncbi:MAG: DUF3515 domain-containing protein [Rhodococcus sp. (in: high G+C Gram-positive bacteria)]|uniref:DUF3515 domain-containing protein n=1 Tax=Rhodococcus sp. TaxID=1831 RepID=UPI003BB79D72